MARLGLLVLLLVMIGLADLGTAQVAKKLKGKTPPSTPVTAESLLLPLVPPDILAKLKLTDAQRPMANQLIAEFTTKNKALVAKVPSTAVPPTPLPKAKFKAKGGSPALPAELQAVLSLRYEYEKKFEELLTEPQKRSYEEMLAQRAAGLLNAK